MYGLHVFHWGSSAGDRFALEAGEEEWMNYLQIAGDQQRPLFAQLEFVAGDDPQQAVQDAKQLRNWIDALELI